MNYGYQPYNNYNPYMNNTYNYQGYQQSQFQQPQIQQQNIQQSQLTQQQNTLQGWYVDGFDVTKSINADMSGNAMFFPSTDGKEIYKKQLDINTGKSFTSVYKLESSINQNQNEIDFTPVYNHMSDMRNELSEKIAEIKDMVLDSITTPTTRKVGGK